MKLNPDSDNKLVSYILAASLLFAVVFAAGLFSGKTIQGTKTVTKKVYIAHPKGLYPIPSQAVSEPRDGGLTLVCEAYGSKALTKPVETWVATAGQRLVTDCTMVKAGPVG